MGFNVKDSEFRAQGSRFRIQGLDLRVGCLGLRIYRFRVLDNGLGFRFQDDGSLFAVQDLRAEGCG